MNDPEVTMNNALPKNNLIATETAIEAAAQKAGAEGRVRISDRIQSQKSAISRVGLGPPSESPTYRVAYTVVQTTLPATSLD